MYKVTLINDGKQTVIHHPYFNDLKLPSGQIKQDINVADGFTFSILPNNPGYQLIRPLKTLIQVFNMKTQQMEFDGRILMPTESMSDSGTFEKSFVCESELGYLNDSSQRHGEYHNISVRDFLQVIIDNHNRDVADDPIDKTFRVGRVEVDSSTGELYRYLGYESTFDTIKDKLLDRLGGELRVRKENGIRYLDYLMPSNVVKNTEIRLAKNLKSLTKEVDATEIITRLVPLGATIESEDETATDASQARLTIESVNGGKDFIVDEESEKAIGTVITKSQAWDDITQPNILMTRGKQFLKENNRVKSQYQISALDLSLINLDTDSFEVGYYYPVINPIMGIDENLRVIGKTTDIINPNQNDLTIGDKFKTASEYQAESNKSAVKVVELENTVSRQIRTIVGLKTELKTVDKAVKEVQLVLQENDIPALQQAVQSLQEALNNLNESIEEIPSYGPVTYDKNGLMIKEDKMKLDQLQNYEPATELVDGLLSALDKIKLNLITVTKAINLDELEKRVERLEGGNI